MILGLLNEQNNKRVRLFLLGNDPTSRVWNLKTLVISHDTLAKGLDATDGCFIDTKPNESRLLKKLMFGDSK